MEKKQNSVFVSSDKTTWRSCQWGTHNPRPLVMDTFDGSLPQLLHLLSLSLSSISFLAPNNSGDFPVRFRPNLFWPFIYTPTLYSSILPLNIFHSLSLSLYVCLSVQVFFARDNNIHSPLVFLQILASSTATLIA